MKFYNETREGDLILIKTNIPTLPPCPVIAQRVVKPATSWQVVFLLFWTLTFFAPVVGPIIASWRRLIMAPLRASLANLPTLNSPRVALLSIIAMAIIEVIAQGYIEKSFIGVIA